MSKQEQQQTYSSIVLSNKGPAKLTNIETNNQLDGSASPKIFTQRLKKIVLIARRYM